MLPDDVPVVTRPAEKYLNPRQLHDYREHREAFLEWLFLSGKEPDRQEGYSHAVVRNTAYRVDKFYRWYWNQDGYTTDLGHDEADRYIRKLVGEDVSDSHRAKCLKALKRLFKWKAHERGGRLWEPKLSFTDSSSNQPRDYFTQTERKAVREAALEYGSIPAHNTVSPEERSRWKGYLAQRFGKATDEIGLDDWNRANGWKIPSLVWTSLDAGLRPIEVKRAKVSWVDVQNGALRIPREESSKSSDNWIVGVREQTASALDRWLTERENYPMYDDESTLWMTREGNAYQSHSLNHVLNRLCEIAGISTETRNVSWYSIRHSTGTYMTREEDLAAAQAQLRHKSEQTTMQYDQTPVEDRKDALNRMG